MVDDDDVSVKDDALLLFFFSFDSSRARASFRVVVACPLSLSLSSSISKYTSFLCFLLLFFSSNSAATKAAFLRRAKLAKKIVRSVFTFGENASCRARGATELFAKSFCRTVMIFIVKVAVVHPFARKSKRKYYCKVCALFVYFFIKNHQEVKS